MRETLRSRVVITGLGAITAIGCSVKELWERAIKGQSGIRKITQFDASQLPCQIAGEIPDFNPYDYLERKEARRIPRSAQIALAAAYQAIQDAALPESMPEPERVGVVFGTAIGGIDKIDDGIQVLRSQGYERVSPYILPSGIPNLPAFLIANKFRCLGPNSTVTTACAAGTQAIGDAAEMIRREVAEIVICGGTEALIRDFAIAGFVAMRALPTSYNNSPQKASRPFDARREGFVFSEGAAALVLENYDHAVARVAKIYAELAGYASSADGYHLVVPDPSAMGPSRAMSWALKDAGLQPEQVDYINAHGTSTPLNDLNETKAIKNVFGEHAYHIPISSTKSMIGHAMGAAGSIEAVICAMTIKKGWIHPTINYEYPDPECDLDYVPNEPRKKEVKVALSNSFGLGGQNACIILRGIS
jgi:beta-ketoacyl-acyl-carrier-protein synthase II